MKSQYHIKGGSLTAAVISSGSSLTRPGTRAKTSPDRRTTRMWEWQERESFIVKLACLCFTLANVS